MRDVFGNHLKYQSFHLVHWLRSAPFPRKKTAKNPSIWKGLTWIVPRIRFVRGENLEGWHTGCRHWGVGNDGRIRNQLLKIQHKGSHITQRKWNISFFPVADGRRNFIGGDQELRTSTLIRDHPIRGEGRMDFLGESEGSLPPPQDSLPDAGEAMNDFWSMSGNFLYRHHVETRVKLQSPREELFPIPLKNIDVSRTTRTNLNVMQESRIDDYWNIDGSRDLSDSWTGFTQFTSLCEETSRPIYVVRWETDKKAVNIQARSFMARTLDQNGKKCQAEGEAQVITWKTKTRWCQKIRRIYFSVCEDEEFKETVRNAREKLETPVAPAMPCKASKKGKHGAICVKSNEIKWKLACILEASESTRLRM